MPPVQWFLPPSETSPVFRLKPPVVFVHGAFGRGFHFKEWVTRFSAAGYSCLAPSLPAHDPSDPVALRTLTLSDYLAPLERIRSELAVPPILIGHSMGGLLAQQLAASGPCAALVCLATAPPGPVVPQVHALPHLLPMLPALLWGRPLRPSCSAFRHLAAQDFPPQEQQELFESIGYESGLAYRAMVFGTREVRVGEIPCPVLFVSGAEDRMISGRISRAVVRRYGAEHVVLAGRGHWLIAPSAIDEAAPPVLEWLARLSC
jgi:pimeloyl-ACP methyl ester carboxylesterase